MPETVYHSTHSYCINYYYLQFHFFVNLTKVFFAIYTPYNIQIKTCNITFILIFNSDKGIELKPAHIGHTTPLPPTRLHKHTTLSVRHKEEASSPQKFKIQPKDKTDLSEDTFKRADTKRSIESMPTCTRGDTGESLQSLKISQRRLRKSMSLRVSTPAERLLSASALELPLGRRRNRLQESGEELRSEFEMIPFSGRRRQEG